MFEDNSCMSPMEQDYYDVCTYAGDQQRYDLILEVIKRGMQRLNNNYEPGVWLMNICEVNNVRTMDSKEVIKLIRENIDDLKNVFCRCAVSYSRLKEFNTDDC